MSDKLFNTTSKDMQDPIPLEEHANNLQNFKMELINLINRNSIENFCDMPDYILADMIARMIYAMGPSIKQTLDWHGCNSVTHPKRKEEK